MCCAKPQHLERDRITSVNTNPVLLTDALQRLWQADRRPRLGVGRVIEITRWATDLSRGQ